MGYDIGYKRPPKSGQFKKGKSGNPKGRRKGARNFVTLLEKELQQSIVMSENGKKKVVSRLQAIVKRMVAGALQGDHRPLLTLVEILRRMGKFDETDANDLLPDDFESILDSYVAQRQKSISKQST
jgi:hypothetical protein